MIRSILKFLLTLILIGALAYAGVIAMICIKEANVPELKDYDAIVVLGAQVKADGTPSVQLQWRMDTAFEMWQEHPCLIVTCGAQGSDEPAPEGEVMRDYLLSKGVPEDQLLVDSTSFNTRQNLQHAAELLKNTGAEKIAIVTSDYHLPRAMALAQDMGLAATGKGSPTKAEYWLKNHAREALSWLKYWYEKYIG